MKSGIVEAAINYIESNLKESISLDKVADHLNYSKFYVNRVFSREVGCTVYKYIQMRRLTEAARELVETNKSISEIAFEANYSSQQAFTQVFHQIYQYPPLEYRNLGRFLPKCEPYNRQFTMSGRRISSFSSGKSVWVNSVRGAQAA